MTENTTQPNALQKATQQMHKGFLQVGFFSLFVNLLMLAPPLYMLQVYDRVLTGRSEETLLLLTLLLGWMFLTMGILELVRSRIMVRLGTQLDRQLNERLYGSVMQLSLQQPEQADSRPLSDLSTLRQFIAGNGTFAFFDAPWMPVYIGILFLFDPMLGWLALFAAASLFSLTLINEYSTRRWQSEASENQATASRTLNSQMQNAEVVKAMGMQDSLQARWFGAHAKSLQAQSKASDNAGLWSSASRTLRLLFQSLMLGLGAYLAINNQITAGMVIAGSIILGRALSPIDQMIGSWKGFVQARLAYRRLEQLLVQTESGRRRLTLPTLKGALDVEKLILVPPGATAPALKGISFSIDAGETLAIIGSSAAGKSSLVRGILGVWPLANGSVRLDGAEIDQWNPDELGPRIGYLPQDVELFEGTVAENISRFTGTDAKKVVKAARIARVDEMIRALPQGYDTPIGPGGLALSGGQRQRIGLARAVFGVPSLVVLDEPNSNLDKPGEIALAKACHYLKRKGSTVIMVSHRKNVLGLADKILVIEDGLQQLFGPRDAVMQHMAASTPLRPVPSPKSTRQQAANA